MEIKWEIASSNTGKCHDFTNLQTYPPLPPLPLLLQTLTSHWAIVEDFPFPEKLRGRAMNREEGWMEMRMCSASHPSSVPQNFSLFNFETNYKTFGRFCWKYVWHTQKKYPKPALSQSRWGVIQFAAQTSAPSAPRRQQRFFISHFWLSSFAGV